MIRIGRLPAERWRDYRNLRLESLKNDPSAFGASFNEEKDLSEKVWRKRMPSVLFALSDGVPVGMVTYVFVKEMKFSHIAEIYGFYVSPRYRGAGIGAMLLESALSSVRRRKGIVKVKLEANAEQLAALRVYERAGFVVAGRFAKDMKVGRRFYDRVFMEKML